MNYEIRELSLGGILDQAINLIKNHFGAFFGVVAVTLLPMGLLQAGAQLALLPQLPPQPTMEDLMAFQAAQAQNAGIFIGLAILGLLVLPITNAALINIVANTYLSKPTSVGSAIGGAFGSIFPLYWTWLLVGFAIVGGFILLVIPGIIAAFWFAMATQVVVIEKINGFKAMGRSRAIMKGNIGTFFVLSFVMGVISIGVQMAAAFIPQVHAQTLAAVVVNCVMTIFSSAAMVVFYFSARCKNEQFDLQLLAQNVGSDGGTVSDDAE